MGTGEFGNTSLKVGYSSYLEKFLKIIELTMDITTYLNNYNNSQILCMYNEVQMWLNQVEGENMN